MPTTAAATAPKTAAAETNCDNYDIGIEDINARLKRSDASYGILWWD